MKKKGQLFANQIILHFNIVQYPIDVLSDACINRGHTRRLTPCWSNWCQPNQSPVAGRLVQCHQWCTSITCGIDNMYRGANKWSISHAKCQYFFISLPAQVSYFCWPPAQMMPSSIACSSIECLYFSAHKSVGTTVTFTFCFLVARLSVKW